jgi:hypothetical protein
MSDIVEQYNSARLTPAPAQMLKDAIDEVVRLRAEIETLRRDVKTAIMGDSAELADVKRENEKLREALKPFAAYADQPARIYENEVGIRMALIDQDLLMRLCQAAAAAIKEETNGRDR